MGKTATAARPRERAVQKRAEETQARLLEAATDLFSTLGFEAVSIRQIETQAGVQRGLAAYHYGSKDALWRCVVDELFAKFEVYFAGVAEALRDADQDARLRIFVSTFVRFSADVPALNRLMVQEGKAASWRMDYIVDTHVKKATDRLESRLGIRIDPHTYYMMVGASAFVFSAEHECRRLFGVDPLSDEFIDAHARAVADLLRPLAAVTA